MCPAEPAGRVLEAYGNVRPRGMAVITRKRRNRIRLIGALPLSPFVTARHKPQLARLVAAKQPVRRASAGVLRFFAVHCFRLAEQHFRRDFDAMSIRLAQSPIAIRATTAYRSPIGINTAASPPPPLKCGTPQCCEMSFRARLAERYSAHVKTINLYYSFLIELINVAGEGNDDTRSDCAYSRCAG